MNFMEKLNEKQLEELTSFIEEPGRKVEEIKRAQGILLLAQNQSATFIKALTGLRRSTVVKARKKYVKEGMEALVSRRKDKQPRSLLTKNQLKDLHVILQTKTPRDYGREWDFWTPTILGNVILEVFGVKYKSKTSLYLLFKRSNFTYHKPEKRYEKRDAKAIAEWKKEVEPEIQEALNDPNVVVLVSDEMILTSQTTLQKIWCPQGTYNVL
jgi:transposase